MVPPSRRRERRPVLGAVNGLRFVAAVHIIFIHTLKVTWFPRPVRSVMDSGYSSTTLLFILSGFVLTWVYRGDDGRLNVPVRTFMVARFSRIFPLMVLSQLVVLPLWLAQRHSAEEWAGMIAGFTGQQAWWPRYAHVLNTPAWAVTVLCLAYAVFPSLLAWLRTLSPRGVTAALAGAWAGCVVPGVAFYLLGANGDLQLRVLYSFPLIRIWEFVFGVVLGAWLLRRPALSPRAAAWAAGLGALGWAAWCTQAYRFPVELMHNGLLAPVQGLLIVGLTYGGGVIGRVLASPRLRRMGERGIAIFLLHLPLFAWTESLGLLPRVSRVESVGIYLAYLAVTFAVAVVVSDRFVDPAARWIRLRSEAARQPSLDAIPATS